LCLEGLALSLHGIDPFGQRRDSLEDANMHEIGEAQSGRDEVALL
jgi:hypothetical protein